jgi:AcrR family transcriptional regulator
MAETNINRMVDKQGDIERHRDINSLVVDMFGMKSTGKKTGRRRAGRPSNPVPREDLIRGAVTCFADLGYAASSLDRIADATGIRKSSLLHRFGSKEALYLEALSTVLGRLGEMVTDAGSGPEDFGTRLDRLSTVITEYLFEERCAATLLYREVMDRGPFFSGPGGEMFRGILRASAEFLQAGVAAGELDVEEPADTVMSICGIHLTYFAIHELSEAVRGGPIFTPKGLELRRGQVIAQVRLLCGVK